MPLTPAYRITKETREVEFVTGNPPQVRVRTAYTVTNYGSSDLPFIEVNLPAEAAYGRTGLRVEVDGQETWLQPLPDDERAEKPNAMRIPFGSAWKRGQSHDVSIEYFFRSPEEWGSRITLNGAAFHLGSRGAFPVLQAPGHLFAPFPKRPKKVFYTVRVPADFRVLARGKLAGRKQNGDTADYRYELNSDDLGVYVVAGRYVETAPLGKEGPTFWTAQPRTIDADAARKISAAWTALEKDYGPLDKKIHGPHIVEVSYPNAYGDAGPQFAREETAGAVAFPGGALVNSILIADQTPKSDLTESVVHALAHNWFGDEIYPSADVSLVLREGLPEYATITVDADLGGEAARRMRIAQFLKNYDDTARNTLGEQTLAVTTQNDPPTIRHIALAKAPLFFAAVEDECGAAAMRSGLKEIVTLLRGQQVDYNVFRAALEHASGKNLAPTFRLWLNEKGIPADFRAKYGAGH